MKTYGFAVVGTGNIAKAHIDAIDKLPNARLIGVTSRSRDKAEAVAKEHGVRLYPNMEGVLKDEAVEVVTICTPSGAHLEPAVAAARAGRHVIVEKPLEVTVERAQAIKLILTLIFPIPQMIYWERSSTINIRFRIM